MKHLLSIISLTFASLTCLGQDSQTSGADGSGVGQVTSNSQGLHGYIGYSQEPFPKGSDYRYGMGFYAAVWSLVDKPFANFQVGLPSAWILPDNSDNKDKPLAPEGTLARTWRERGPT